MNVYRCWHRGILGYGCRRGRGWMFVPELGQPDNRIYKHLALTELVFRNRHEWRFEMKKEDQRKGNSFSRLIRQFLAQRSRPHSVNGTLFTTH